MRIGTHSTTMYRVCKRWAVVPLHPFSSLSRVPMLGPNLPDVWAPPPAPLRPPHSSGLHSREHAARLIDGRSIAKDIKSHVAAQVREIKAAVGRSPGLAIILVGRRNDSKTFIHLKLKACQEVGIESFLVELPETCTEDEVIRVVSSFNKNPSVHGIIVQLPLPKHLDEENIITFVSPEKDVDGLHPLNMGNLAMRGREPFFVPCAPKGCIEILLRNGVEITGKKAAVIGRSKIVGLPTSLLLQRHHATVSTVHAYTSNPEQISRGADIVISDAGISNLVRRNWLKPGAIVIDTGTNSIEDSSAPHGFRITGDVCFEEAIQVVSAITPVPGGVGPVTISMLLSNTLDSAKRLFRIPCR